MSTKSTIIDEFVSVKPGDGFRLFPFGTIYKNGKRREITPEFAATVKLPHFKAPIKLGSHEDPTPAGGFITKLEVREDGLYAIPEWNDAGEKAQRDGAYRYNSPEILWTGGLEDPTSGGVINAPLIVGTALLHTPHLGEAAALYSVDIIESNKEQNMTQENITFPASFWDKFVAPLLSKPAETKEVIKEVVKVVEPEDYSATKAQLEQYKAEIEKQKAEAVRKERVEKFSADLGATKVENDPSLAELLADLPEDKAGLVMKQFKALSAQINDSAIAGEQGSPADGTIDDPKAAFNAAVLNIVKEKSINYNAAFEIAKASHADLFKSAFPK